MSYHDFTTGRPYDPVHNEYVTKYVDVDLTPLFPFGYGLTYGQLELNVHALPSSWDGQSPLEIDIELINHHDKDITETIQLYYQLLPSIPVRGAKRLFNYKKITVPQSSHVTLQLSLDKSEMTIYDEHHLAYIDPGKLHLYIGFNSLETTHITLDWSPQHDH